MPGTSAGSHKPPQVSQVGKLQELVYLGMTRLQIILFSSPMTRALHSSPSSSKSSSPWSGHKHGPHSAAGLFNSHYVEPMFLWWGLNTCVLLGPAVGLVSVKDSDDSTQAGCLNGASHNYAGSYLLSERAEALHKLCLDVLPVTLDLGVLLDAVHQSSLATRAFYTFGIHYAQ
ncbi:serine palmitoyltransferase 2 [Gaeumannomyces tritici R3-111a-1]|uniref:Serine palmitoyltransferase 2 n=1 Tax=Gaeumannomyces tritici (strain R3-111a-1) TaxID=644352 RepID=J3P607_GAET3|nr:serine palmitoyltransferase 2 [Gaeumannomyces tritici R3-111a-1]EJT75109.1 serine palmitoyltransferase 2 [Gaeumannomyces tritici R3-111a-1]